MVLTGFGRGMRITERMAKRLPTEADVLELDVNDPDAARGASPATLDERWGAPRRRAARDRLRPGRRAGRQLPEHAERLGRRRLRDERVLAQGARGGAAAAARARRGGAASSAWTSTPRVAWPAYDWAGRVQGRAGVDQPLPRARPRPARRALATSSPPARCRPWRPRTSRASTASPRSGSARRRWAGTSPTRRRSPTPACSCSRRWPRAITGEILHVDGGVHAMGAGPVAAPTPSRPPTPTSSAAQEAHRGRVARRAAAPPTTPHRELAPG